MVETLLRLRNALADRYVVEREIGSGGMALVFLAEDAKHHRRVAIKALKLELGAALGPERFLREIEIAAGLNHPHILPLHDSGDADGLLYYVMPYVEGESLRQRLSREKQLPIEESLQIAREIADALGYAHSLGVVHRDIKPENILIQVGHAVVADFGIARAIIVAGGERLTETGLAVGTAAYMSPEQASGQTDLDGRSDIYSLGCVLYEMLAGQPPFTGPTAESILHQHGVAEPARITNIRPSVPPWVANALGRALAKTPADRFTTAVEFAAALAVERSALPQLAAPRQSIAVLAFVNMTPDPDNEYFSDGITEEIIAALTKVDLLHVAARTSAFAFKGKSDNVQAIGQRLNVATVLEGSVRKSGTRVRITAQLINVANGYHLWSERYDRELTDIFAVQDEIAGAIVEALRITLGPRERARLAMPRAANVEAYTAYLRGRYHWNNRTGEELRKAITSFQRSIDQDPTFGSAYAGLADAYNLLGWYGYLPLKEAFHNSKAAATKALAMDEGLPEARAALGFILWIYDWRWDDAEEQLELAIHLGPNYATARHYYAWFLAEMGRSREALQEILRARELDPLSRIINADVAYVSYFARSYDRVEAECSRTLEIDANFAPAHLYLGWAFRAQGRYEEAISSLRNAVLFSDRSPLAVAALGYTHALAGHLLDARQQISELEKRLGSSELATYALAIVHLGLKEYDRAFELLTAAIEQRAPAMPQLNVDPVFDDVRTDRRFKALLRKLELERV